MRAPPISIEAVRIAVRRLEAEGTKATRRAVHAIVGGSMTTVAKLMAAIEGGSAADADYEPRLRDDILVALLYGRSGRRMDPKEVMEVFAGVDALMVERARRNAGIERKKELS